MTFEDRRAERGKTFGNWAELHVGSGDLVPEIQQDFGDSAHADSTDPGEVQLLRR